MLEFTPTVGLKIGDKVNAQLPPPLTWWDRVLWRLFRIERKRPLAWQELVVMSVYPSEDQTSNRNDKLVVPRRMTHEFLEAVWDDALAFSVKDIWRALKYRWMHRKVERD